jgi:hypothetical protein
MLPKDNALEERRSWFVICKFSVFAALITKEGETNSIRYHFIFEYFVSNNVVSNKSDGACSADPERQVKFRSCICVHRPLWQRAF